MGEDSPALKTLTGSTIPSTDDPTLPKRTADAGHALFDAICAALANERGVHLETAIACAGSLAGYAMLVQAGVDLSRFEPGSPILIDKLNEIGPMLLDTLNALCERGGASGAMSSEPVPAIHAAQRSFAELLTLMRKQFDEIVGRFQIPPPMQPFIAIRAAAQMVIAGREQLEASIAKAIAAEAIIACAKTVPPR